MNNDNVEFPLFTAAEGLLRKQIRTIVEAISPVPGVPLVIERTFQTVEKRRYDGILFFAPGAMQFDWVTFVRKHGGPLLFAKKVVGDENVALLRSWLKRQRSEARHEGLQTDFYGKFASIAAIVYGKLSHLICQREADAKPNGLSDRFRWSFEAAIARKPYGPEEGHLQPDWDGINQYSNLASPTKGMYLGRMYLDPSNPFHSRAAKATNSQHMLGRWVIDIRYSGWYLKKVAKSQLDEVLAGLEKSFVPVALLGKGYLIYDQAELAQFQDRFYNRPGELIWRQVGTGKARRWSVWYQTSKGWLWAPLTHNSSRRINPPKYEKKVKVAYKKGDLSLFVSYLRCNNRNVQVCDVKTKQVKNLKVLRFDQCRSSTHTVWEQHVYYEKGYAKFSPSFSLTTIAEVVEREDHAAIRISRLLQNGWKSYKL